MSLQVTFCPNNWQKYKCLRLFLKNLFPVLSTGSENSELKIEEFTSCPVGKKIVFCSELLRS